MLVRSVKREKEEGREEGGRNRGGERKVEGGEIVCVCCEENAWCEKVCFVPVRGEEGKSVFLSVHVCCERREEGGERGDKRGKDVL